MDLAERTDSLPTGPGVYLFKSADGRVLYVGKAQNLRSRVRSYLTPGGDGRVRIPALLERAADVDALVTPSVKDALLLENELIKRHKPPFNVRLRDDKQYLALRLDPRERWPRVTMVRRFARDGAWYFGPYTSSQSMREALSNLRRIFPLRSCSDAVFRDYARRGRPCIEHEMQRCAAPCCERIDTAHYAELVAGTALFLRGRSHELVAELSGRMQRAATEERFEEAARLRDRIAAVERTVERQQIVGEHPVDRDVFGLARSGGEVAVQALWVREGRVAGAAEYAFSDVRIDDGEVMGSFLGQYYGGEEEPALPAEVLCETPIPEAGALEELLAERAGRRVALRQPRRGPLRELVAMATANAELGLARRLAARESVAAALEELREQLALARLPRRIECYDVSHLQGSFAVASRVVFEDGQPRKADYRRYAIREAPGGDDTACLREVLLRRLGRKRPVGAVVSEPASPKGAQRAAGERSTPGEIEPLPDLLMVDGGRGQLGVVSAVLADLGQPLDHLGLAKERDAGSTTPRVRRSGGLKAERVFLPGRKDAVLLPPSSRGLLLLQQVRDEAHRFAIEFQRSLHRRAGTTSILEELPGIGPGKRRALLRQLGSLRGVRMASPEELAAVPGLSRRDAETIHRFFHAALAAEAEAGPPGGPEDDGHP